MNETEQRIVRMLRGQATAFHAKGEEAVAVKNERQARDMFAGAIAMTSCATAIEAGEHNKEEYGDD